jgi:hypothetical protein
VLGSLLGGAGGAYLAHGKDTKKKKTKEEPKTASALADYSEVFEAALAGNFGDEVQNWATQIEQAS